MSYSGNYTIKNKHKYMGMCYTIKWRSTWEYHYICFCDNSPGVVRWVYEEPQIQYYDTVRKKVRKYIIDFYVETVNGDKLLIEIKPHKQANVKPIKPTTRKGQKSYLREIITWTNNTDKWKAARKYASVHGMEFRVLTEYDLGIRKKPKKKRS